MQNAELKIQWMDVENSKTADARELLDWAREKAASDCKLPEECCGKCKSVADVSAN